MVKLKANIKANANKNIPVFHHVRYALPCKKSKTTRLTEIKKESLKLRFTYLNIGKASRENSWRIKKANTEIVPSKAKNKLA